MKKTLAKNPLGGALELPSMHTNAYCLINSERDMLCQNMKEGGIIQCLSMRYHVLALAKGNWTCCFSSNRLFTLVF
ncbi:hypothetical protein C5167_041819 [Papaver somniferum]|nr:hypothetical protein C5167_041819 [Papaver somniferum]